MTFNVGDRVQIKTQRDRHGSEFRLGFPANGHFGNVRYIHTQKPCEFCIRVDVDNGHLGGFSPQELVLAQKKSIRIPIRAKHPEPEPKKLRISIKRQPDPVKRVKIKLRRS